MALLAGLVGHFVVVRGQVFAGDALSHVAYTRALAALAAGLDLRLGLFIATIGIGFAPGLFGGQQSTQERKEQGSRGTGAPPRHVQARAAPS